MVTAGCSAIRANTKHLCLLLSTSRLFSILIVHVKGQFADSRAHLIPGFCRVHATVAAVAAMTFAVVLPSLLALYLGWSSIGLVAVMVLLLGAHLWGTVTNQHVVGSVMMAGCLAIFLMQSCRTWFRELLVGQLEIQAFTLLGLGTVITVLAAIRFVRLNEDMPQYYRGTQFGREAKQRTRQASRDEGRIVSGLPDWINDKEMARLTRMASRAPKSLWSRICRWQVGMVAGWSFWIWVLTAPIFACTLTWLVSMRAESMIGMVYCVAFVLPAGATIHGVRRFKSGSGMLLPVQRNSYIRQVGSALALSHFQFWAGMCAVAFVWWLLVAPVRPQFILLANVLAFSAASQIALFGAVAWMARYRSKASLACVWSMLILVWMAVQTGLVSLSKLSSGQSLLEAIWIAGSVALIGLVITIDAYRRWLATDFD